LDTRRELAFGRWRVRAPRGLVVGRKQASRQVVLQSDPPVLVALFRETFRRVPGDREAVARAARRRCGEAPARLDGDFGAGGVELSCARRVRLPAAPVRMEHFFWVAHPDGAILEVATFGDRAVQRALVARMVASLEPRRRPLPRRVASQGFAFEVPPGWGAFWQTRLCSVVGHGVQVGPLGEPAAELEIWASNTPRAPRGEARPWRGPGPWRGFWESERRGVLQAASACGEPASLGVERIEAFGPRDVVRAPAARVARTLEVRHCRLLAIRRERRAIWSLVGPWLGLASWILVRAARRRAEPRQRGQ
jgi:hypothetical protein